MFLDVFYLIYFLFYLPVLVLRGRWHGGFSERFGFLPGALLRELASGENIWVHAVSVGEVALVEGVIRGLAARYPACRVVLSVTTRTGHAFALKKYPSHVKVIWAPLDLTWTVGRYVKAIRPKIYVVAETELWPHLFARLDQEGVPIVLVNGRISDEAYGRYRRVRWWLKATVLKARCLCVQSVLDAQRFIELGALKERVIVVGNIKFDVLQAQVPFDLADVKKTFGFRKDEKVLVAASTHPGEEAVICEAYKVLRLKFPRLRLAIAPRHPERASEVAEVLKGKGLAPCLFSSMGGQGPGTDAVLLIDGVGHLLDLYRASDVVIMGKSLGVSRHGGQNLIEPAAFGKPVIVGPRMDNFRDVMRLFKEAGAVIEVPGADALAGAVEEVLAHPERMAGLCARARAVVAQNQGAAQRTVDIITGLL